MRLHIDAASSPGGAGANEDAFLASGSWALALDGITRYPDDGCLHDVPWYVAHLAAAVAERIAGHERSLRTVLAGAIGAVNDRHADTCDLRDPVSPGATAAIVRAVGDRIDWLVLGDCAIVLRGEDGVCAVRTDDRLARLTTAPPAVMVGGIRRWPVDYVARVRNRPGGFWVASTDPAAAAEALTGSVRADGIGDLLVCTDGLTRLVERYGWTWESLIDAASLYGVAALIDGVREAAGSDTRIGPHAKRHDDATGIYLRPVQAALPVRSGPGGLLHSGRGDPRADRPSRRAFRCSRVRR